jgi:DNA-binding transcriptional ArsR family regulator
MENIAAITVFAALAQPTRLEVFKILVRHEPNGLAAGEIAGRLGLRHNTLSTHLGILARAGLVDSERQSRSIIYRASLETLRSVITFLVKDCCGGRSELCGSLIDDLSACLAGGGQDSAACPTIPPFS